MKNIIQFTFVLFSILFSIRATAENSDCLLPSVFENAVHQFKISVLVSNPNGPSKRAMTIQDFEAFRCSSHVTFYQAFSTFDFINKLRLNYSNMKPSRDGLFTAKLFNSENTVHNYFKKYEYVFDLRDRDSRNDYKSGQPFYYYTFMTRKFEKVFEFSSDKKAILVTGGQYEFAGETAQIQALNLSVYLVRLIRMAELDAVDLLDLPVDSQIRRGSFRTCYPGITQAAAFNGNSLVSPRYASADGDGVCEDFNSKLGVHYAIQYLGMLTKYSNLSTDIKAFLASTYNFFYIGMFLNNPTQIKVEKVFGLIDEDSNLILVNEDFDIVKKEKIPKGLLVDRHDGSFSMLDLDAKKMTRWNPFDIATFSQIIPTFKSDFFYNDEYDFDHASLSQILNERNKFENIVFSYPLPNWREMMSLESSGWAPVYLYQYAVTSGGVLYLNNGVTPSIRAFDAYSRFGFNERLQFPFPKSPVRPLSPAMCNSFGQFMFFENNNQIVVFGHPVKNESAYQNCSDNFMTLPTGNCNYKKDTLVKIEIPNLKCTLGFSKMIRLNRSRIGLSLKDNSLQIESKGSWKNVEKFAGKKFKDLTESFYLYKSGDLLPNYVFDFSEGRPIIRSQAGSSSVR